MRRKVDRKSYTAREKKRKRYRGNVEKDMRIARYAGINRETKRQTDTNESVFEKRKVESATGKKSASGVHDGLL